MAWRSTGIEGIDLLCDVSFFCTLSVYSGEGVTRCVKKIVTFNLKAQNRISDFPEYQNECSNGHPAFGELLLQYILWI